MSDDSEESSRKELTQFLDILVQNYSLEELRTLCFKLGINYDDLGGEGLSAKARELIGIMGRTGRFGDLLEAVKEERPLTDWPDITDAELPSNWETTSAIAPRTIVLAVAIVAVATLGIFLLSKFVPGAEQPVAIGEPIEVILPTATATVIPSSTPAPFAPPNEDEELIVILPFHITSSGSSDAHNLIYGAVEDKIRELGLQNVRVEIDPNVILQLSEREAAQELGESYNAAVLIWGTETRTSVKVNFLNIKEPEVLASDERVRVLALDTLVGTEFIEEYLPEQLAFLSLFAVGQAFVAEDDSTKAIPIMEEAVASISEELIAEELASPASAAAAYRWLGWLFQNPPTQDYQQARDAYEKSLAFEPTNNITLENLGAVYQSLAEYEIAKGYHEQALEVAREIDDRLGEGVALDNLGAVYQSLAEYEIAKGYHEQALAIAREIGDRRGEGNALNNLGIVHQALGEYETAKGYHEQALSIFQEIGGRGAEGIALNNLGIVHQALGEYETAKGNSEQALAIAREIGDREAEGNALNNLGIVHQALGEYETAKGHYEQALEVAREIGDRRGEGNALNNLGVVHQDLGEYEIAKGHYEQALEVAREIGDRRGERIALRNLGVVYSIFGENQIAKGYHEQALAIAREIGDRRGEGNALNNLGIVHQALGEYETAKGHYEQALAIAREISDREAEGNALNNLGFVYESLEEYEIAVGYYEQALAIAQETGAHVREGVTLSNLGYVYHSMAEYETAIIYLEQSLSILEEFQSPYAEETQQLLDEAKREAGGE